VIRRALLAVGVIALACAATVSAASYGKGTRGAPYPIHATVTIPGSKGWKVRVNSSVPNGTSKVLAANQFNDKPKAGRQFFLINVTVSYTGKGSSQPFSGLTFKALGRSDVAYDYQDDCGVLPSPLDDTKTVFSGGKLTGNICFSVKKTDVPSLLVYVEPAFSFSDTQVFFKLR
jgi:hypothetical protein